MPQTEIVIHGAFVLVVLDGMAGCPAIGSGRPGIWLPTWGFQRHEELQSKNLFHRHQLDYTYLLIFGELISRNDTLTYTLIYLEEFSGRK